MGHVCRLPVEGLPVVEVLAAEPLLTMWLQSTASLPGRLGS
jgi:hypothetical protein